MTEIPEHLLKRSRERRQALEGGGESNDGEQTPAKSAAATPAQSAPATPAGPQPRTSAPAPPEPQPPEPDSFVVTKAKQRRKVPAWAMMGLALLPVWTFMYTRAVTTQTEEVAGPLAIGAEVYSSCASCHGATGGGGSGYQFSDGEVLKTFPHIEDQLRFVYFGTAGYNAAGVEIYGNPDREGGPHIAGAFGLMPPQADELTSYEILGVVCHERYTLGGAADIAEYDEEFEVWCSEESPVFEALEGGTADFTDLHETVEVEGYELMRIGDVPIPGTLPSE